MTPTQQQYDESENSIILPKRGASPSPSTSTLPYRRSNNSLSTIFASTTLSRPSKSSGTATPTGILSNSVFSPAIPVGEILPSISIKGRPDEPRNLIQRSFAPHVGVLASSDTEEILHQKGFAGGLLEILKPFGENVPGNVNIRNGVGASTSWNDFGIHFTGLKYSLGSSRSTTARTSLEIRTDSSNGRQSDNTSRSSFSAAQVGGDVAQIEETVDRHLAYAELHGYSDDIDHMSPKEKEPSVVSPSIASPFYNLYLRRLLSAFPMTPHETFSHPVACVIAISSRNPAPIDALRRLYMSTNTGDDRLPQWVNNEFLRYYVLVHDEDHDDIAKSTALYEQMKRHFGLHCHLLRLRSAQCVLSDDDSKRLPTSQWMSAAEELAEIQKREVADDDGDPAPYLFESDATGINTFVRELVTQSIIPSMERSMAQWNEQVAARRRGVTGRLISLSKRWASPFGSSSRNSSSPVQGSSRSNYDSLQGFYRPDTPEAIMRKLADYAFMLRDYKLAASTYDLSRADFEADKAWSYYAGANEMAAASTLLSIQTITFKSRAESIDRMLEGATHSYIHRCVSPFYALRTLAISMELLKLQGSSAADDGARWASRILENGLVGNVGHALFTERIGACYSSKKGVGSMLWGSRVRKSAFWAILAADSFLKLQKTVQAEKCLHLANRLYSSEGAGEGGLPFDGMSGFLDKLKKGIIDVRLAAQGFDGEAEHVEEQEEPIDEEVHESFVARPHRASMMGHSDPLGVAQLSPVQTRHDEHSPPRNDNFE